MTPQDRLTLFKWVDVQQLWQLSQRKTRKSTEAWDMGDKPQHMKQKQITCRARLVLYKDRWHFFFLGNLKIRKEKYEVLNYAHFEMTCKDVEFIHEVTRHFNLWQKCTIKNIKHEWRFQHTQNIFPFLKDIFIWFLFATLIVVNKNVKGEKYKNYHFK